MYHKLILFYAKGMNLFCLILRSVSEKQPMLFQIYTDIHWIFHVLILFVFFQRILKYCFLVPTVCLYKVFYKNFCSLLDGIQKIFWTKWRKMRIMRQPFCWIWNLGRSMQFTYKPIPLRRPNMEPSAVLFTSQLFPTVRFINLA